jgi:uncharacterized CHY-type Zn-finger protein
MNTITTREVVCGNCTDNYTQTLNRMWEQQCPWCGHPSPDADLVYAGALTSTDAAATMGP